MPKGNGDVKRIRKKRSITLDLPYPALSTNKLYLGVKRRSYYYKSFRKKILKYLNDNYCNRSLSLKGNLRFEMDVGFSSPLSDLSNSIKAIEDVVVEWANSFDDRQIVSIELHKYLVNKGEEFMFIKISKTRRNIDRRYKKK